MATSIIPTSTPPQQPGLRAFIICDRLPEGCVAYPVTNRWNEPHLSAGEWVIVDPTDREPEHDGLFVIQWKHGGGPVVMVAKWMHQISRWGVAGTRPAFVSDAEGVRHLVGGCIGDFGYRDEYMRGVIKGRVVGILEPTKAEPERLAA